MESHVALVALVIANAWNGGLRVHAFSPIHHSLTTFRQAPVRLPDDVVTMNGRPRRRARASGMHVEVIARSGKGVAGDPVLQLQHSSNPGDILRVAHEHRATLRRSHLAQALLRIAKPLTEINNLSLREELLKDPRLKTLFMISSTYDGRPGDACQAADVIWACGLLGWCPDYLWLKGIVDIAEEGAAELRPHHTTTVVWALDRLGIKGQAGALLRDSVACLPFRTVPSLFQGLTVDDFKIEVPFKRDEIQLGDGKVLSESRLTAWQSSGGLEFSYSGKVMPPSPFTPNVLRLRDAIHERTGVLYDGVLLNLYETRSSAMRYHSDPDVGTLWTDDTCVVSVGDTRQFALRETKNHDRRHEFFVFSGDAVVMGKGCQENYQHCIKVAKGEVGPRISLVFKQSIASQQRNCCHVDVQPPV
ncbi:unnamed protein product [Choristocarpus tenellus]